MIFNCHPILYSKPRFARCFGNLNFGMSRNRPFKVPLFVPPLFFVSLLCLCMGYLFLAKGIEEHGQAASNGTRENLLLAKYKFPKERPERLRKRQAEYVRLVEAEVKSKFSDIGTAFTLSGVAAVAAMAIHCYLGQGLETILLTPEKEDADKG